GHLDLLFRSVGDLLEGELQAHAQVAAFHHAAAAPSAAETTESAATEGIAEDVAELGEDILHVHAATLESAAHAGACVAEAIVARFFLGIAQDLVGRSSLLELLLCALVSGVLVRMVLDRQFAVRLLDLVRVGIPA